MSKRKTIARSLMDFLIWWCSDKGFTRISSHEIQGVATRWVERDREITVTPASVNRAWRQLREDELVETERVDVEGAEDVWKILKIDGQNVDTMVDFSNRQTSMF